MAYIPGVYRVIPVSVLMISQASRTIWIGAELAAQTGREGSRVLVR